MLIKTRARLGAIAALVAIEEDDAILGAALDKQNLGEALGFAREISSGVLRHRARLDWTIAPLLKKPLEKLDAPVRAALRLGLYERIGLQTHIAVVADEYAGAMRAFGHKYAVGFVNAVSRRLPAEWREVHPRWPRARQMATEFSHPPWLVERWLEIFGESDCAALLQKNNERAPLSLRVNTLRASRDEVRDALVERGLKARDSEVARDAIIVEDAGSPLGWPEWTSGKIIAQDEAAQSVSQFLDPQPSWKIADVAAAPGGKTTHLAQLMNDKGTVLACDIAPGRIKLIEQNAARLGLKSVQTRVGDWREVMKSTPEYRRTFDAVLLDAPCLGTGTLRRRPDAKWKKTRGQLEELVVLQRELLDAASSAVKPGGVLVYATCSLEREENQDQASAFLQRNLSFETDGGINRANAGDVLQTLPQRDGCDGAFAARFRRKI